MNTSDFLDVWVCDHLGRRRVGVLQRLSEPGYPFQSRVLFQYSDPQLAPTDEVSLLMPIRMQAYETHRTGLSSILPPIFDQNLPEGALKQFLISRYQKTTDDLGDFDLLRIVGHNGIGRVRVAHYGATAAEVFEQATDTLALAKILGNSDSEQLLQALLEKLGPMGVSGVQPKALLPTHHASDNRVTLHADRHIIKVAARDFPWLTINEHICLYAAQMSGLKTAQSRLSQDGKMLAIERFDLREDGTPLGFEDACSLSALTADEKYKGSYEKMIEILIQYLPPVESQKARQQLFHMIALCCLMENGDAHLKNFGLLYADPTQAAYLAPAFDLVCTTSYMPQDHLALSLGGSKRFPDKDRLTKFGRHTCRLTLAQINAIYKEIAIGMDASSAELHHYCEQYPEFERLCGMHMQHVWRRNLMAFFALDASYSLPRTHAEIGRILDFL